MPPGYSNLASIVRRQLEGLYGYDNQSLLKIAGDLTSAATSIDPTNARGTISQVTPQILKTPIEVTTNKNLFTGSPVVPRSLENLPPQLQANDRTSTTAKNIGQFTGLSPMQIDNAIKTNLGGLGSQLVNVADTLQGAEKPGGESAASNLVRRFTQASGGEKKRAEYAAQDKQDAIRAVEKQVGTGKITQAQADRALGNKTGIGINTASAAEKTNSPVKQSKADGKFYFFDQENVRRSYDTQEKADIGYARYQVSNGEVKDVTVEGKKIVADPTSDKGYKEYDLATIARKTAEAKQALALEKAKRSSDYKTWESITKEQYNKLESDKAALDPQLEADKITTIENKQADIIASVQKYRSYGGAFKKTPRVKSPKAINVTKSAAPKAVKVPKIAKPKAIKVKKPKSVGRIKTVK
jgi:hypothetical protein